MDRYSASDKAGATAAKLHKLKAQRQADKALGNVNSNSLPKGKTLEGAPNHQEGTEWERALAEKDEIILGLQNRLSSLQQQQEDLIPAKHLEHVPQDSESSVVTHVQAENARLQGANQQLRQRLQESLVELQHAHDQVHILQQLQQQLEEDIPNASVLVKTAISQERAVQAVRNEKVLQLLKSKDEVIVTFEARYAESRAECLNYKKQLDKSLTDLDNKELRVSELIASQAKLREKMECFEAAAAQAESAAKQNVSNLQDELTQLRQRDAERCTLHDRIIAQQHDLAAAHGEVQNLSEAVEAANVVIQDLQAVVQEKECRLNERNDEFCLLQNHLARIMDVPEADMPSLISAAIGSSSAPEERIAQLEVANEYLERALVKMHKEKCSFQSSCDLENALEQHQEEIQSLKQQIDELESLEKLAQETAMQLENKLKSSEKQTATYRQHCDQLQEQLEQSEAAADSLNARVSELALTEQTCRSELQQTQKELQQVKSDKSLCSQKLEEVENRHAEEQKRMQAQLADAEMKLHSCQDEMKALQAQLSTQHQLHQPPRHPSNDKQGQSGSNIGLPLFVQHQYDVHTDAANPWDLRKAQTVSNSELEAMNQHQLVELVHTLQANLVGLQDKMKQVSALSVQHRMHAAEQHFYSDDQRQHLSLLTNISSALNRLNINTHLRINQGDIKAARLRLQRAEEMLINTHRDMKLEKAKAEDRYQHLLDENSVLGKSLEAAIETKQDAERAKHAAEQRAEEKETQIAVLSETVEVLQSRSPTVLECRILSITTELAAAKMKQAAAEQHCTFLKQQLQSVCDQISASQQQLKLKAASTRLALRCQAADAAALRICREEIDRLNASLFEYQERIVKLEAELLAAKTAASTSQAAAAGLQEALQQSQERHLHQLSRERAQSTAAVHAARIAGLQSTLQQSQPPYHDRSRPADTTSEACQSAGEQNEQTDSEAKLFASELQAVQEQRWITETILEKRTADWQAALAEAEFLRQLIARQERATCYNNAQGQLDSELQYYKQQYELRIQLARFEVEYQQALSERDESRAEAAELVSRLALAEASEPRSMCAHDHFNAINPSEQPLMDMLSAYQRREVEILGQNMSLRQSIQDLQGRLKELDGCSQNMSSTKLLQDLETCFKDTVAHFEEFQNSAHLEETKVHELQNQVQDLQVQLVLKEAQVKDLRRLLKDSEQQAIQKFSRNSLQECEGVARGAMLIKGQAQEAVNKVQEKALDDVLLAQQQIEHLKQQLISEQEEKVGLQSTLAQLESQLAEACAAHDAKAAALSLVQQHDQSIHSAMGRSSIASLSQRLLECTILQAEANKELQIAEKLNKSLEKQLHDAENRAAQLKEAYVAKNKQVQLLLAQKSTTSIKVADSSLTRLPDYFSDASQIEIDNLRSEANSEPPQRANFIVMAVEQDIIPIHNINSPRLQHALKKKEADIERLQRALDKAFDNQRGQAESFATLTAHLQQKEQELQSRLAVLEQARQELSQLHADCSSVIPLIKSELDRGDSVMTDADAGQLPELARKLLAQYQKQNKAIDKLQQYADAASSQTASAANCSRAEELPSPLECSQRTVIRSLTLQLADVRRQLVHLCSERDQLRDRLRALRGSLGSGRAVEAHTSADIQDLEIFRVDPGQLHVQAQTSAKQGSLDHINGMFVLLDHHVNAVTKAHERLSVLLQCEPPLAQEQSQDGGFQQFGKCEQHMREVKSQVAYAAAMLAAELPAMQATIQVLSAEAIWRQQQGEHQHLKLADDAPSGPLSLPMSVNSESAQVSAGVGHSFDNDIEGKLSRARQRKDKLKKRCLHLEEELTVSRLDAEEREATLKGCLKQIQHAHEQLCLEHNTMQAQLLSLQSAVEEATTEKEMLQNSLESSKKEMTEVASLVAKLHKKLQAQQHQHNEAESKLQQELQHSQASLEQQRSEHAQLVASVRGMIGSLQSSGSTEVQLRSELIQLAEKMAVLTAAQEAARLEVENKEAALADLQSELTSLQTDYDTLSAQKQQSDAALTSMKEKYIALQHHLQAAEVNLLQVEEALAARCAALEAKVEQLQQAEPISTLGLHCPMDQLQAAADNLQDRFERVEAQAAIIIQQKQTAAVTQWAHLARSQRFRSAVQQLRNDLQNDLLEARVRCYEQDAQLIQLREAASNAEQQCTTLLQHLDDLQSNHAMEMEDLVERHKQDLAAAEQEGAARMLELQQQTDSMLKAAVVAAEQRTKTDMEARMTEIKDRALGEVGSAEKQCQQLQSDLEASRLEFKRYQALKAVEVKLLEQRVLQCMHGPGELLASRSRQQAGKPSNPDSAAALLKKTQQMKQLESAGAVTAVSEIWEVCSSEGICAALREAKLERMQREQVEEEAATLHDAAEQLRSKLRAAEGELSALRARVGSNTKSAREKAEKLQSELHECQQALRVARVESSRRLKDLQALQKQVSEGEGRDIPEEVLEEERQQREAAQAQLREVKQALNKKNTMVKELRYKVSELQQELVINSPAPLQLELESCQARLKQLQASCATKESTIKELRRRLEEHVRLAAEQGVQEERQRSRHVIGDLQAELDRREGQIAGLQEELQQVQQDLASAKDSMHSTVQELQQRQSSLESTGHKLVRSLQHGQQLSALVQELLALVEVLGTAVAAGAAKCTAQVQQPSGAAVHTAGLAEQVSTIVDLPLEDVQALLSMQGADSTGRRDCQGGLSSRSLQGMLAQARDLVQELHAGFDSGDADKGALVATLAPLLAAVKQHCYKAKDALELAMFGFKQVCCSDCGHSVHRESDAGKQSGTAITHLEHQLLQAAREVAEIEERLF